MDSPSLKYVQPNALLKFESRCFELTMIEHSDSFLDVPRLSTLQAQLIILKAREAVPKRGYYYRSWMTVVNCVAMAKDLGLADHYEDHQVGKPCGSSPAECLTKSRIWQTIFVCETMLAASQGKLICGRQTHPIVHLLTLP